jgi:hypothetical protein
MSNLATANNDVETVLIYKEILGDRSCILFVTFEFQSTFRESSSFNFKRIPGVPVTGNYPFQFAGNH